MAKMLSEQTAARLAELLASPASARVPPLLAGSRVRERIMPFRAEFAAQDGSESGGSNVMVFVPPDAPCVVHGGAPVEYAGESSGWIGQSVAEGETLGVAVDPDAGTWDFAVSSPEDAEPAEPFFPICGIGPDGSLVRLHEGVVSLGGAGGMPEAPFSASPATVSGEPSATTVSIYLPLSAWLVSHGDGYPAPTGIPVSGERATASLSAGRTLSVKVDPEAMTWTFETGSGAAPAADGCIHVPIARRDSEGNIEQLHLGPIATGGSGGGGEETPTRTYATVGRNTEGGATPDAATWARGAVEGQGLKLWTVARVVYDHAADTPRLLAMVRQVSFDCAGRAESVSAETAVEIDTPVSFEQEGYVEAARDIPF